MIQQRQSLVKICMTIMGILGLAILCLPWYELNSSASVGSYTSSGGGIAMIGWVATGQSFLGYALDVLPLGLIYVAFKLNPPEVPTKGKAGLMMLAGAIECIVMIVIMNTVKSYDVDYSGYGSSAHAGYDPVTGFWLAIAVYALTSVLGIILWVISPDPDAEKEAMGIQEAPAAPAAPAVKAAPTASGSSSTPSGAVACPHCGKTQYPVNNTCFSCGGSLKD